MNVLKTHLFLIICGLVVVLAAASLYWPIGTCKDDLRLKMSERLNKEKEAASLDAVPYNIPGQDKNIKGPVTPGVIKIKTEILDSAKIQADKIGKRVAQDNEIHRIKDGLDGLPLLGNKPQAGYLPKVTGGADAMYFKDTYEALFKRWLGQLVQGTEDPSSNIDIFSIGSPPTMPEIELLIKAEEERRVAQAPHLATGAPLNPVTSTMTKNEREAFVRIYVSDRAKKITMYATRDAFQIRPWAYGDKAPNEQEIFEAFVDSWIQQDIVDAITAINNGSKFVETSPIKRLERILIGASASADSSAAAASPMGGMTSAASTGAGSLFVLQGSTSGTPSGGVAVGPALTPGSAAGVDYSRSMTGRVSTGSRDSRYDVTHFKVIMDIDPSYLNRFIKELYQQNNGYTVLTISRMDAIDPFEAASKGYLYGKVPAVRAEIVVECLFFRRWTRPLMPDAIKNVLGIPLVDTGLSYGSH